MLTYIRGTMFLYLPIECKTCSAYQLQGLYQNCEKVSHFETWKEKACSPFRCKNTTAACPLHSWQTVRFITAFIFGWVILHRVVSYFSCGGFVSCVSITGFGWNLAIMQGTLTSETTLSWWSHKTTQQYYTLKKYVTLKSYFRDLAKESMNICQIRSAIAHKSKTVSKLRLSSLTPWFLSVSLSPPHPCSLPPSLPSSLSLSKEVRIRMCARAE